MTSTVAYVVRDRERRPHAVTVDGIMNFPSRVSTKTKIMRALLRRNIDIVIVQEPTRPARTPKSLALYGDRRINLYMDILLGQVVDDVIYLNGIKRWIPIAEIREACNASTKMVA